MTPNRVISVMLAMAATLAPRAASACSILPSPPAPAGTSIDDYKRQLTLKDQAALWDGGRTAIVARVIRRSIREVGRTSVTLSVTVRPTATLRGEPVRRDVRLKAVAMGMCPGIGSGQMFAASEGKMFVVFLPPTKHDTFAAIAIDDVVDPRISAALAGRR